MKFGDRYARYCATLPPTWRQAALSYARLKALVRLELAAELSGTLDEQLRALNAFFVIEESSMWRATQQALADADKNRNTVKDENPPLDDDDEEDGDRDSADIHAHVRALMSFTEWNYMAVEKIAKKARRRLQLDLSARSILARQYFFTSLRPARMLVLLMRGQWLDQGCAVCLAETLETPACAACGHIFCLACLSQTTQCPVCRRQHSRRFVDVQTGNTVESSLPQSAPRRLGAAPANELLCAAAMRPAASTATTTSTHSSLSADKLRALGEAEQSAWKVSEWLSQHIATNLRDWVDWLGDVEAAGAAANSPSPTPSLSNRSSPAMLADRDDDNDDDDEGSIPSLPTPTPAPAPASALATPLPFASALPFPAMRPPNYSEALSILPPQPLF